MNKDRKIKELTAQQVNNILRTFERYAKVWAEERHNSKEPLKDIFINLQEFGDEKNFEVFLDRRAFDEYVRPAIQKALEDTLRYKRAHMRSALRVLDSEITKYRVKIFKCVVPENIILHEEKVLDHMSEVRAYTKDQERKLVGVYSHSEVEEFTEKLTWE